MKSILPLVLFSALLTAASLSSQAQTNSSAAASTPSVEDKQKASLDKHIKPVLSALNLNDAAKEEKTREVLSEFLVAHDAWHQTNDAQLKDLWNNFNRARGSRIKPARIKR